MAVLLERHREFIRQQEAEAEANGSGERYNAQNGEQRWADEDMLALRPFHRLGYTALPKSSPSHIPFCDATPETRGKGRMGPSSSF